jgi:hypothetical protein
MLADYFGGGILRVSVCWSRCTTTSLPLTERKSHPERVSPVCNRMTLLVVSSKMIAMSFFSPTIAPRSTNGGAAGCPIMGGGGLGTGAGAICIAGRRVGEKMGRSRVALNEASGAVQSGLIASGRARRREPSAGVLSAELVPESGGGCLRRDNSSADKPITEPPIPTLSSRPNVKAMVERGELILHPATVQKRREQFASICSSRMEPPRQAVQ